MCSSDLEAPGDIQELWDMERDEANILLITSGSAASAMRDIFENGRAPLFARQDIFIHLFPFSPNLLKKIYRDCREDFTGEDMLSLYALSGAVAQYVRVLSDNCPEFDHSHMLDLIFRTSSPLVSEAVIYLQSEFKREADVYYEILKKIATGTTKRSELVSSFSRDIGSHLAKLERVYGLIEKRVPLESEGQKGRTRYEFTDELLAFWFRYLEPNAGLLQSEAREELRGIIVSDWSNWTGRVLERFYYRHARLSGRFTRVGGWWDRKGENEIDLIGINDLDKTIVFAEIKRNSRKASLQTLEDKAMHFLVENKNLQSYERSFMVLSLDELSSSGQLPFGGC